MPTIQRQFMIRILTLMLFCCFPCRAFLARQLSFNRRIPFSLGRPLDARRSLHSATSLEASRHDTNTQQTTSESVAAESDPSVSVGRKGIIIVKQTQRSHRVDQVHVDKVMRKILELTGYDF